MKLFDSLSHIKIYRNVQICRLVLLPTPKSMKDTSIWKRPSIVKQKADFTFINCSSAKTEAWRNKPSSASLVNILSVRVPQWNQLFGNINNIHFQQTQLSNLATILLTERSLWRLIHWLSHFARLSVLIPLRIHLDRSNDRLSILLLLEIKFFPSNSPHPPHLRAAQKWY